VTYELHGMTREALIADKSMAETVKVPPKANLTDPRQIPAADSGASSPPFAVSVGPIKVSKGDKLVDDGSHENASHRLRSAGWRGEEILVNIGEYGRKARTCCSACGPTAEPCEP